MHTRKAHTCNGAHQFLAGCHVDGNAVERRQRRPAHQGTAFSEDGYSSVWPPRSLRNVVVSVHEQGFLALPAIKVLLKRPHGMVRRGGATKEGGQMKERIPEKGLLVLLKLGRLVRLRLLACSRQKAFILSSTVDCIRYKPFHTHSRTACASGEGCGAYPCLEPTPSQASAGADGALPPPPLAAPAGCKRGLRLARVLAAGA